MKQVPPGRYPQRTERRSSAEDKKTITLGTKSEQQVVYGSSKTAEALTTGEV